MTGRVHYTKPQLPQFQLLMVGKRAKRVGYSRRFVEAKLRPVLGRQSAGARNMIGMDVRIDDVSQPKPTLAKQSIVRLRLDRRIDNGRVVGASRGDNVGSASATLVQELLEVHE